MLTMVRFAGLSESANRIIVKTKIKIKRREDLQNSWWIHIYMQRHPQILVWFWWSWLNVCTIKITTIVEISDRTFRSPVLFRSADTNPVWRMSHGRMVSTLATAVVGHCNDVIMTKIASQITSLTVVYSTVYSEADQRKHQSSASLAFVWGIHRDRWIPRTKGQLRGKCFHLMTSSWRKGSLRYIGDRFRNHAPSPWSHSLIISIYNADRPHVIKSPSYEKYYL